MQGYLNASWNREGDRPTLEGLKVQRNGTEETGTVLRAYAGPHGETVLYIQTPDDRFIKSDTEHWTVVRKDKS